jgi:hypothetical protein
MKFRYKRYEVRTSPTFPDGVLYRPDISVLVTGAIGEVSVRMLADTGADETLLPRSIGDATGARMDESQGWSVEGFGGQELQVVPGAVELALSYRQERYRWEVIVGFVAFSSPTNETAVLGHIGFFEHFTVKFDTRKRQMTIKPNH